MQHLEKIIRTKKCLRCGKEIYREQFTRVSSFKEVKYCSRECFAKSNTGENHWYWKGGVKTRPDGYMRDSKTDRYIHRIVMEEYLGRTLLPNEHVHHIDGNPKNNSTDNLILVSNSQHRKIENKYAPRDKKGRYKKKDSIC